MGREERRKGEGEGREEGRGGTVHKELHTPTAHAFDQ